MYVSLKKIPGFYPTPLPMVGTMLDAVGGVSPGERFLEPSAGSGAIADEIRRFGGSVSVVEPNPDLGDLLKTKGYAVQNCTFEEFKCNRIFDKIVMNPPFASGADIAHARRSVSFLKAGGKLASIIKASDDERSTNCLDKFCAWLECHEQIERWSLLDIPQDIFLSQHNFKKSYVAMKLLTLTKRGSN